MSVINKLREVIIHKEEKTMKCQKCGNKEDPMVQVVEPLLVDEGFRFILFCLDCLREGMSVSHEDHTHTIS